jgi:hypothetical protein
MRRVLVVFALVVHDCQHFRGLKAAEVREVGRDEVGLQVVLLSVVEEFVGLLVWAQHLEDSQSQIQLQANNIYTPFAGVSSRDISPCENLKLANKSRHRWKRSIRHGESGLCTRSSEGVKQFQSSV